MYKGKLQKRESGLCLLCYRDPCSRPKVYSLGRGQELTLHEGTGRSFVMKSTKKIKEINLIF
jgi:hypothetical protein